MSVKILRPYVVTLLDLNEVIPLCIDINIFN